MRSRLQSPHPQPRLRWPAEPQRSTFLILFTTEANAPLVCEGRRPGSAPAFKQKGKQINRDGVQLEPDKGKRNGSGGCLEEGGQLCSHVQHQM